nr:hypothetical protein [uncultured bacterium]
MNIAELTNSAANIMRTERIGCFSIWCASNIAMKPSVIFDGLKLLDSPFVRGCGFDSLAIGR